MAFANPGENIKNLDLKEGDVVVDIGAGSGFYSLALAERIGSSGLVYAVDVNKEQLGSLAARAKELGLNNVDIIWGDADVVGGVKLKDGVANLVVLSNVLFQSENKENMAKEAARLLKAGGEAMVIDWDTAISGLGPKASQVLTTFQAEEIFGKAGFALLKKFSAGDHHFGLIFKKL